MMTTVDLKKLELTEFIAKENPGQRCRATFPLLGAMGTRDTATVYFELDPGEELGSHTARAEEILLILEGEVEATVGEETGQASAGSLVLVPKMEPHNVRNIGSSKVKVLGFFGGANNITATFEHQWWPLNARRLNTADMPG